MPKSAQSGPAAESARAAGEAAADVIFVSDHANLIVYLGGKEPVRFAAGRLITSNAKIIAALREREGQDGACPYKEADRD